MSKRKLRPKRITEEEFEWIRKREWKPVKLTDDTLLNWMKPIPKKARCHVYASGSSFGTFDEEYEGIKVGGVDVFRDAKNHREPVDWNKDHYVIIENKKDDGALLMYPSKDNEHWINEIPEHFKNIEISTYDRKEKKR